MKKVFITSKCRKEFSNNCPQIEAYLWRFNEEGNKAILLDQVEMKKMPQHEDVDYIFYQGYSENIPPPTNLESGERKIEIGLVQLRNPRTVHSFGFNDTLYIQNVFIRNDDSVDEEDGLVLEHMKFDGILFHGENVLLSNPRLRRLQKQDVLNLQNQVETHHLNHGKRLLTAPEPRPAWAFLVSPRRKGDEIVDERGFFETLIAGGFPYVINRALQAIGMNPFNNRYFGMPGFAKFPTYNVDFTAEKVSSFLIAPKDVKLSMYIRRYKRSRGPSMVNFSDFRDEKLQDIETVLIERIYHRHLDDREFGRLFLESVFCTHIQVQWRPKPEQLDVDETLILNKLTDADLYARYDQQWIANTQTRINHPKTLLFFVDYSALKGVPRNKELESGHFQPARCLFCLDEKEFLVPTEIILYEHHNGWTSYFPNSPSWNIAKLVLKCAASQVHQAISHALRTHFVIEPFHIALESTLPQDHIIYRVLKPHMRFTIDINFKARTSLIGKGGGFDKFVATGGKTDGHLLVLREAFATFKFDSLDFQEELKSRGFHYSPEEENFELPHYVFAKDANKWYKHILKFVTDIVNRSYQTDEEVFQDEDLKRFFKEVRANGFPGIIDEVFTGTKKAHLIAVLVRVIFTASVSHAALNFPQFAHFSFVANSPLGLTKELTPQSSYKLEEMLPKDEAAIAQITTAWTLSRYELRESYFYKESDKPFYSVNLWNDPGYKDICDVLQSNLKQLNEEIQVRPTSPLYGTRYLWLQPTRVPTSIAI